MRRRAAGFTYLELMATLVILLILASAIAPTARVVRKRQKEIELRRSLRVLRTALDDTRQLVKKADREIEPLSVSLRSTLEAARTAADGAHGSHVVPRRRAQAAVQITHARRPASGGHHACHGCGSTDGTTPTLR